VKTMKMQDTDSGSIAVIEAESEAAKPSGKTKPPGGMNPLAWAFVGLLVVLVGVACYYGFLAPLSK
jgi:hypothetical protein